MRVIYLPLEPYRERYTEYTSARDGIYETCFRQAGAEVITIRPHEQVSTIQSGSVLDINRRCEWAFDQTSRLLYMLTRNIIKPGQQDVIYLEDFWHPGFEMIPYTQQILYSDPKKIPVFAFMHAQSADPHDFTHPMAPWIRFMECGIAKACTGIFCAHEASIQQWAAVGLPTSNMRAVGTVFSSDVLSKLYGIPPPQGPGVKRDKIVAYTSRLDPEKNPDFFCDLIDQVMSERSDIFFRILTGSSSLKSTCKDTLSRVKSTVENNPWNVTAMTSLTKRHYYTLLRECMVQFNCAHQDFISYTLLEAALCGCIPLYPRYLTFPDALVGLDMSLYEFFSKTPEGAHDPIERASALQSAKDKLYAIVDGVAHPPSYNYVYSKYNNSVNRIAQVMSAYVHK